MPENVDLITTEKGNGSCGDVSPSGNKSSNYDYVVKSIQNDKFFDNDCTPWLYGNMQVDNMKINGTATGDFKGTCDLVGKINVQSWKGFDIQHPNKSNHRLRHICLEGPEAGVYYRGRLKDYNIIDLPEYWYGLIDPESITVSLSQIGYSQDLIIEKIEWGKRILIKSGTGANIDCYYVIHAARIDGEPLIVEYEGESPADYPGNDAQYSMSGYDYGRKK